VGHWFELTVATWPLITTTFGAVLLGIAFGLLALGIGARTGARGTAIGIAAAVAAASYLISAMAPLVDWLEPLRYASLFFWSVSNNQLVDGLSLGGLAILLGTCAVLGWWSVHEFRRHELH
jgi:ABC-2 type transport system permease protein